MAVRRIRARGGLATDPSALDQPEGLAAADNVLLHRPGTIQPRPGFGVTDGIGPRDTDERPIAIVPFDGDLVVQAYDAVSDRVSLLRGSSIVDGYSSGERLAMPSVRGTSSFMQARGSLYYTTAEGVKKLEGASATSTSRAGAWMTYQPPGLSVAPASNIENAALQPDTSVAYRWCVMRRDSNGYEVRSAPSSRVVWAPFSSSTYPDGVNINVGDIRLPADAMEGDVLELYRTRNSGSREADPGEDYWLVGTYTITALDVSIGRTPETTWFDNRKDHELGAALYTSPSQFGALAAKERPPYCVSLAWWNNAAWAANLHERALQVVTVSKVAYYDTSAGTAVNESDGLCVLQGNCSGVSGNTLTGVTWSGAPSTLGWASLREGMWIGDSAPFFSEGRIPNDTRIVSFDEAAQTITLDQPSAGPGAFRAGDIVRVQGIEFFAHTTESMSFRSFGVRHSDYYGSREYQTALSLARVVTAYFATLADVPTNPPPVYAHKDVVTVNGDGGIMFMSAVPGRRFVIDSPTRGEAFTPALSELLEVDPESKPGAIAWSAPDEPEAWPPTNTLVAGQIQRNVLALAPTRDALLVWKEDGLYAITGAAPSSWSVHEVDTTIRLVAPQAVCVLDDVCFALTDRGVVAATIAGVQIVSGPIASDLRQYTQKLPLGNTAHKRAYWMVAHQRLGLVVLGVGDAPDAEATEAQYVFHARAEGRWSRWMRQDRCAAYDPTRDAMVVAPAVDGWRVVYERAHESSAESYVDASLFSLPGSAIGGEVRIAASAFAGYAPDAGDVLRTGADTAARIESAVIDGGDWVLGLPGGSVSIDTLPLALAKTLGPGNLLPAPDSVTWSPTGATATPGLPDPAGGGHATRIVKVDSFAMASSEPASAPAGNGGWVSVWVKGSGKVRIDAAVEVVLVPPGVPETRYASVLVDLGTGAVDASGPAMSAAAPLVDGWRYVRFFVPEYRLSSRNVIVRLEGANAVELYGPRVADSTADPIVADASTIWALPDGSTFYGATSFAWHQAIPCAIEWHAQHLPGQGTRWQEAHVVLERATSTYVSSWPLNVGGRIAERAAAERITAPVPSSDAPYQTIRVGLPRSLIRAYQMGPRLEIACAGVLWRVAELALHFTPQQKRVRR